MVATGSIFTLVVIASLFAYEPVTRNLMAAEAVCIYCHLEREYVPTARLSFSAAHPAESPAEAITIAVDRSAISSFAFVGVLFLLRRLDNWRFMIMVAATATIVGAIVLYHTSRAISLPFETTITISDFRAEYPALIMSVMALMAVFYLERLIRERKSMVKELRLREFSIERAALSAYWIGRDGELLFVNRHASECARQCGQRDANGAQH